MYSIHIIIFLLCCVLFLPYNFGETVSKLAVRTWSSTGRNMELTRSESIYKYSENEDVTFTCMANFAGKNSHLHWEIVTPQLNGTAYEGRNTRQMNYTTKLKSDQSGTRLTCVFSTSTNGIPLDILQVILQCDTCPDPSNQYFTHCPDKINDLYLVVQQSNVQTWTSHLRTTHLLYSDEDTIILTCIYKTKYTFTVAWLENGQEKQKKQITLKNELTDPKYEETGLNYTCVLNNGENNLCSATIILKHSNTTNNKIDYPANGTVSVPGSEIIDKKKHQNQTNANGSLITDTDWIVVGTAIVILIIIIIIIAVAWNCKSQRTAAADSNEISYKNFQNSYTEPKHAQLDPTYSGPVDDANLYCYATTENTRQDTYSTPFVPTVQEMYTEPTPKSLRPKPEPAYQFPSQFSYASLRDLKKATKNLPDNGYSNVQGDGSDTASETYAYCTLAGYSRPK